MKYSVFSVDGTWLRPLWTHITVRRETKLVSFLGLFWLILTSFFTVTVVFQNGYGSRRVTTYTMYIGDDNDECSSETVFLLSKDGKDFER